MKILTWMNISKTIGVKVNTSRDEYMKRVADEVGKYQPDFLENYVLPDRLHILDGINWTLITMIQIGNRMDAEDARKASPQENRGPSALTNKQQTEKKD